MSMASSSSSTTNSSKKHDVFLSFHGEDTRYGFRSHLDAAFGRKKINAFIDEKMDRGDDISSVLLDTIKASTISVIIFSKNYASSRWCLQELEEILHCKKTKKQFVIPVFYYVDPSHVRNVQHVSNVQSESFKEGFAKLKKHPNVTSKMLQGWETRLNEAANLSGWTIGEKKYESELVDKIVGNVWMILNKLSPIDYSNLVVTKSAAKFMELLSHKESNRVSKIGIWGLGGVGKTTIAGVVFNEIFRNFEGSYFAANVREEYEKSSGLTHLKEKLFSKILEDKNPDIESSFTKGRLGKMKVLTVFDDVTLFDQIKTLIGNPDDLSSESQIIITARDKQVLRNCGVNDNYIYEVKGLTEKEAHQLFKQYAFGQYDPPADYMELSKKAVAYTKCLPLAVKVLGSHLLSRPKGFWESEITNLGNNPLPDIQKVLKVSYDGLRSNEKKLFLDIACFFKGEDIALVEISEQQIMTILIDKCLVFVTYGNKITMHDLLQDMGREIGRHIRLWDHRDILKAINRKKGIEAVQSISLDASKIGNAPLDCRNLSKMDDLRLLRVYNWQDQDNYKNKLLGFEKLKSFPEYITFFGWNNYPFNSFPLSHVQSLTTLVMQHSKVKDWNGVQNLKNLIHVDLSFSKHMTEIPDLSRASNLQNLILNDCSSLSNIPSYIQNLNKLAELDLSHCERLTSLPDYIQSKSIDLYGCHKLEIAPKISCKVEKLDLSYTPIKKPPFIEHPSRLVRLEFYNCLSLQSLSSSICKLKFLKHLTLVTCPKLKRLPEDFGNLEALEDLNFAGTVIKELPSSILGLPKLCGLYLDRGFDNEAPLNWVLNSSSGSSSLVQLSLAQCNTTKLPDNLSQLTNLKYLDLHGNNFESIPEKIKALSNLYLLNIRNCPRLQLLPELPMGVNVIASNCSSLQRISDPSNLLLPYWRSRTTAFVNCFKLDLPEILHEESCREFCADIYYPGNEIPKWFTPYDTYIALGQSLDWHNKSFLGFFTSVVICPENDILYYNDDVTCYCLLESEDGKEQIYKADIGPRPSPRFQRHEDFPSRFYPEKCYSDHVFFRFHSVTEMILRKFNSAWDREYDDIPSEMKSLNCKVLIKFNAEKGKVKKCGIHFLYVKDYGEPLETTRSVDNARKKGKEKEKEKDELQSNKLQISNHSDGICRLRPHFTSNYPIDLKCLEAWYWKLKRNALREIVKSALLNFQQNTILCSEVEEMNCVNPKGCMSFPGSEILDWFSFQNASPYIELPLDAVESDFAGLAFCTVVEFPDLLDLGQHFFVNCEWQIEFSDGSCFSIAIGSIQGWFEGDRTHHIKLDHVFLGYDCVMYSHQTWYVDAGKNIIKFYVTNYDGVCMEGFKVKRCGVRLLYRQDFENKWKNPIDLSSLKRRLILNGNGRCNDKPPSYGLSAAHDWQSRSSATSLNFNEMVGSTSIDTPEPHSIRLTECKYENKCKDGKEEEELNPSKGQPTGYVRRHEDEKEGEALNPSTSQPTKSRPFDLNELSIDDEDDCINSSDITRFEDEKEVEDLNPYTSQFIGYVRRYEAEKEVEELNQRISQPTGFPLFELNELPIDDEDEPQPKRIFQLLLNFLCHRC